jgi:Flp pilus assembly protein TadG
MRLSKRRRRPGITAVEFAMVAPVFFLIMLGIFEYSRLLFTWQLLHNAAREGARYAVVSIEKDTTAGVQTYVNNYLAGQGSSQFVSFNKTTNITVYKAQADGSNAGGVWTSAGWGDFIGVSVSGTYQPIVPGFVRLAGSMTLSGTCVMTAELD